MCFQTPVLRRGPAIGTITGDKTGNTGHPVTARKPQNLLRGFDTRNCFAGNATEMQMVVIMMFGGTVAAQGIVGFSAVVRYFVHQPVIAKALQDAVHRNPVYFPVQLLHNVALATRRRRLI